MMIVPATPSAATPLAEAAIVGVDWGTTQRRVVALDARGEVLRELGDDQGMLAASGRFAASLAAVLRSIGPLAANAPVVLSGMVGSAQGWHDVPYLDCSVSLHDLGARLFRVPDAPDAVDCSIVPGYRWQGVDGAVDVMRGEETQLFGAIALGARDGWFVLPGTHSKWVRLRDGRIERFATYMTGELFALLSRYGTLASVLRDAVDDDAAFARGLRAAARGALSNSLFGCRAKVVTGALAAASARDYLSGVLIGSEWHDALARRAGDGVPLRVIGTASLARRYARAGAVLGFDVITMDARAVQLAALSALQTSIGLRSVNRL